MLTFLFDILLSILVGIAAGQSISIEKSDKVLIDRLNNGRRLLTTLLEPLTGSPTKSPTMPPHMVTDLKINGYYNIKSLYSELYIACAAPGRDFQIALQKQEDFPISTIIKITYIKTVNGITYHQLKCGKDGGNNNVLGIKFSFKFSKTPLDRVDTTSSHVVADSYLWSFWNYIGNHGPGVYSIRNKYTNLAIDAFGSATVPNSVIVQFDNNNLNNQLWTLDKNEIFNDNEPYFIGSSFNTKYHVTCGSLPERKVTQQSFANNKAGTDMVYINKYKTDENTGIDYYIITCLNAADTATDELYVLSLATLNAGEYNVKWHHYPQSLSKTEPFANQLWEIRIHSIANPSIFYQKEICDWCPKEEGLYNIVNYQSGLALDSLGSSRTDGEQLGTYSAGNHNAYWYLTSAYQWYHNPKSPGYEALTRKGWTSLVCGFEDVILDFGREEKKCNADVKKETKLIKAEKSFDGLAAVNRGLAALGALTPVAGKLKAFTDVMILIRQIADGKEGKTTNLWQLALDEQYTQLLKCMDSKINTLRVQTQETKWIDIANLYYSVIDGDLYDGNRNTAISTLLIVYTNARNLAHWGLIQKTPKYFYSMYPVFKLAVQTKWFVTMTQLAVYKQEKKCTDYNTALEDSKKDFKIFKDWSTAAMNSMTSYYNVNANCVMTTDDEWSNLRYTSTKTNEKYCSPPPGHFNANSKWFFQNDGHHGSAYGSQCSMELGYLNTGYNVHFMKYKWVKDINDIQTALNSLSKLNC